MKNHYEVQGDTTIIYVKKKSGDNEKILIDSSDLSKVKSISGSWNSYQRRNNIYVIGYDKGNRITLHRFILQAPRSLMVDHINHNTLDNRKQNLRIVSNSENLQNLRGAKMSSKSGIRNVHWNKQFEKWEVRIRVKDKRILIGRFTSLAVAEQEAIKARKQHMPMATC